MASPSPALSQRCPYPGCKHHVDPSESSRVCACQFRNPVVVCPSCRTACPAEARFCRSCRQPLPSASGTVTGLASQGSLFVKGVHYASPVAHGGFLWCLRADGAVSRLAPRDGAEPRVWSTLPSRAAGFNRIEVLDAPAMKPPYRGGLLLACDPAAVYAVSLLTGDAAPLYRPPAGAEIVANRSAQECICFRGIAAGADLFALLLRRDQEQAALVLRYLKADGAGEEPLTISGSRFLGPVVSGTRVAVASEHEVWVYDYATASVWSHDLRRFEPFFVRSASQVNVTPGSRPLALAEGPDGLEVWLAGVRDERPGLLRVAPEAGFDEFTPLPSGAAITSVRPGGLCINHLDRIRFCGAPRPEGRFGRLLPGMPVSSSRGLMAYFRNEPGRRPLCLVAGGMVEAQFDDPQCNEDSCFGVEFLEDAMVVSYFVPPSPSAEAGLRFAVWTFERKRS